MINSFLIQELPFSVVATTWKLDSTQCVLVDCMFRNTLAGISLWLQRSMCCSLSALHQWHKEILQIGGGRVSNGVCLCMQKVGGSGCITPPLVLKCSEIASEAIFGPKQPSK